MCSRSWRPRQQMRLPRLRLRLHIMRASESLRRIMQSRASRMLTLEPSTFTIRMGRRTRINRPIKPAAIFSAAALPASVPCRRRCWTYPPPPCRRVFGFRQATSMWRTGLPHDSTVLLFPDCRYNLARCAKGARGRLIYLQLREIYVHAAFCGLPCHIGTGGSLAPIRAGYRSRSGHSFSGRLRRASPSAGRGRSFESFNTNGGSGVSLDGGGLSQPAPSRARAVDRAK